MRIFKSFEDMCDARAILSKDCEGVSLEEIEAFIDNEDAYTNTVDVNRVKELVGLAYEQGMHVGAGNGYC